MLPALHALAISLIMRRDFRLMMMPPSHARHAAYGINFTRRNAPDDDGRRCLTVLPLFCFDAACLYFA